MREKNKKHKKNPVKILWILLIAAALLVVGMLAMLPKTEQPGQETGTPGTNGQENDYQENYYNESVKVLNDAIRIETIGDYTGMFVEDGSDEGASDLLMMVVTNITSDPIQYAKIELDLGEETATFVLSVLPAGESAMLIEQNKMTYSADEDYYGAEARCTNLAGFDKELTRCEDKLQIQLLEGGANIRNISGKDITGDIIVCYKNVVNDVYHGGIAYRIRLEGGLKADELRQIMTDHIHASGTKVMFVEIGE